MSLYGLTLRARRRVDYAGIDPVGATRVFIREALAADRYSGQGEYLDHNRRLAAELAERSARLRRTDLLPDRARQAQFYASRLPRRCPTPQAFERWRSAAERDQPRLLCMTLDDLSAAVELQFAPADYPDTLEVGRNRYELRYRFAPGEQDDGVSLLVPVAAVAELDADVLDWLVPGLLHEKVGTIIRGLPKALRRRLVPAPERAREFVGAVSRERGFYATLASFLTRAAGEPVAESLCRAVVLPDHLRLRIVACDDSGEPVAADRDLAALRAQLGGALHEALALGASARWNQDGLTDWSFDELPERVRVRRQGVTIDAAPGLEDRDGQVDLRLFEAPEQALRSTRRGMARLVSLRLPQQAQLVRKRLERNPKMALLARVAGGLDLLGDELVLATILEALPQKIPRTRAEFDRFIDTFRAQFVPRGEKLADVLAGVLEQQHALRMRLTAVVPAVRKDIAEQLDHLVFPGFVTLVPTQWLIEYPRYLQAIDRRLDAIAQGRVARDAGALRDVRAYWARWIEIEAASGLEAYLDDARLTFRFMIEEYRVSLFAQQLGTRHRVSPRRLDQLLARSGKH